VPVLEKRIGLIIIGLWLSKATDKNRTQMRTEASEIGRLVIDGGIITKDVAGRLFKGFSPDLVIRKADLLEMILMTTRLEKEVRDSAYRHAASKAFLSDRSIEKLQEYVTKLRREAPTEEVFNASDDYWWPDFNE
jgi:hypothetical protein